MARFRKIDTRIHNDEKFRSLSDPGQLVFFKTLTHPHLTMVGAMRASIPGLAAEFNRPLEAFREAFGEVYAKGMVRHDATASFLWFPNYLKYNKPESPNVVKAWPDAYDLLPDCSMKAELFQQLKAYIEGLTKGFQDSFIEAFPQDFAKNMANQEREKEQKIVAGKREQEGKDAREARSEPGPPRPAPVVIPKPPVSAGANGEFMAANWLGEELGIAFMRSELPVVAQVIRFEARTRAGDIQAGAEFIRDEALKAQGSGERVDFFWIKDKKWNIQEGDVYTRYLAQGE